MNMAPSPGNSILIKMKYPNVVGKLAQIIDAIAKVGGSISYIEVLESNRTHIIRDITIDTTGLEQSQKIIDSVKSLDDLEIIEYYDCTFKIHESGKLDVVSKRPLRNIVDLSMAYTPGVARVCTAIAENPELAKCYTIKSNTVAVLSDGTAVLGLGDIGPMAAMPVMEGKAVLFKEFGGVNAFPLCVDAKTADEIVDCAIAVAPTFGGINLEDIAAPVCFEVERRVSQALDIPVFHDDQHGTAVVVGAAFINAVKLTGYNPKNMRVVVSGAGAAGVACTRALMDLGVGDVVICDRSGSIYRGREKLTAAKQWLADNTNKENLKGSLSEVLVGADLFLGLSGPNILTDNDIRKMNKRAIVFALSNPIPEVAPEAISDFCSVVATGRSDYANQINNVLCFPGLFKGLLASGAKMVTREMLTAAANAIASVISDDELTKDYIIPNAFNKNVAEKVADAVCKTVDDKNSKTTPIYFDF